MFMALFTLLLANIWFPYLWKVYWLLVPAERPPDLNQNPKSLRKLQGLLAVRALGRENTKGHLT